MEARKNCWEYFRCGRAPGGDKADELGICPAATEVVLNGTNGGRCAGRCCWAVAGTFCNTHLRQTGCSGKQQGIFAEKFEGCLKCPFYKEVEKQEGRDFTLIPELYFV